MSSNLNLLKTVVISCASVIISYFINFFLTPYVTDHVGVEAYGFVAIGKQIVGYANIVVWALTVYIVRFITVNYHENKIREAQGYYSSAIYACSLLTVFLFFIGILGICNIEQLLNISSNLVFEVQILFFFVFICFIPNTLMIPVSSCMFIKNRLDIEGIIRIISAFAEAAILYFLYYFFDAKLWFIGIGVVSAVIIHFTLNCYLKRKLTPNLSYQKSLVSKKKIKDLLLNGIWSTFNMLGNMLNSGLDLIISNLFLGGVVTGQIAITRTVSQMFGVLYSVLYRPFQPSIYKAYADKNIDGLVKVMLKCMKICGCFSNIALAGFFALGELYFRLWLPNQDYKFLYVLTVCAVLESLTAGVIQPIYSIYGLTLKNRVPFIITITGGIINIVSMLYFINYTNYGAYSIVCTTTIIMLIINLFFNPLYSAWCLGISARPFYIVMLKHFISAFVMILTFKCISLVSNPGSWIALITNAIVMIIVGILIHVLLVFSRSEIILFYQKIKSV